MAQNIHKGNPSCTPENRCGKCHRDIQSSTQAKIRVAKLASATLADDQRQCSECLQVKATSDFRSRTQHQTFCCYKCLLAKRSAWKRDHRQSLSRGYPCIEQCGATTSHQNRRCLECFNKTRQHAKPTVIRPVVVERPRYACLEACGQTVSTEGKRCSKCAKSFQQMVAQNSETKVRTRRLLQTLAKGQGRGLLFVGEDAFALLSECSMCGKAVILPSKCYRCATGREITLEVLPRIIRKGDALPA